MPATETTPRAGLYRLLADNRKLLTELVSSLPPEQLTAPIDGAWSIKDILTHITSWEELVLLDLRRLIRGRTPTLAAFPQEATDKWNEVLMCVRRALPLDQVLAEFRETREAIMASLDEIADADFTVGYVPDTCQITAFHDWEHARQITEWRQDMRSEGEAS